MDFHKKTPLSSNQPTDVGKSNGELKKQFITTGSVQLNGGNLTNPNAAISPNAGDVLKLSNKHAVRFV